MVTPASERLNIVIAGRRYTLARDRNGARMYEKTKRQSQPGDPGGVGFRDWTPWGHDLNSHDSNGFLGREYGDGTDGRWGVIGETIGCLIGETRISDLGGGVAAASRRAYHGDVVEITTRLGRKLTATPNHPILSGAGWLTADALHVGDNLVCDAREERVGLGDPDVQREHPSIDQVFHALASTSRTERRRQLPVDFHGDGQHGDVDVVYADGLLWHGLDASLEQPLPDHVLPSTNPTSPAFVRERGLMEVGSGRLGAVLASRVDDRTLGRGHGSDPFEEARAHLATLNTCASHVPQDGVLGDATPQGDRSSITASAVFSDQRLWIGGRPCDDGMPDAAFAKDAFDRAARYAKVSGDPLHRFASTVTTDEIIAIEVRHFDGHVFNLTTASGTFSANGIVTHNCDTLGPQLNTLALSTYDSNVHAADLLGSTFILGSATGLLGGAVAVAPAMKAVSMKAAGVTYGYIGRGQIPAKIIEATMTLQPNPPAFTAPVTDLVMTKSALGTTRNEVSAALGDNVAWQSVSEYGVGTTDTWAANSQAEKATIFGITPSSVAVLTGTTVKQNILTGTVTMGAPNLATVSTLTNEDVVFTGFAMDRNLWVVMTSRGPYMVNDDTGEFTQIIPEIDNNTENGRQATTWFPVGTIVPLRDGVRFQKSLQGQSWGVERFLSNASPVQGYPTGGDGSTKWFVQAVLNEVTGVTWLVAWRPRQVGDVHANPLSPYVIGKIPSSAVSRFVNYVGYANGERTTPAWEAGNGSDALWWLDGRTSRFIDDTAYRYTLTGTTYLAECYLSGVVADIEAIEFLTNSTTASRTVTPQISINGGAAVALTAQTTDGFHRVLASSAGAPLATLQGAYRIKPSMVYASNVATAAPQTISLVRVYWRWRPLEVTDYQWTFELQDQENGQTAYEQEQSLLALEGTIPVLVNEDVDNQSYYVRVNKVEVKEHADLAGNALGGERHTARTAQLEVTTWLTA